MTSYSKRLYNRDPAAAMAFYRQQAFEQRAAHGRVSFTQLQAHQPPFGRRHPMGVSACAALCGHPACANGCTLQNDGSASPLPRR